jgi:acetyltransferase-like isoleucine patch superfamily enzyme/predicted SAM-dependent methyltransferase
MFFPERVKSINKDDKVLEIGPGATPHPRSDIFLELKYESTEERIEQSGYVGILKTDKPIVYYDGSIFPFEDNEFDYVICSHVLEHVPIKDIDLFMSELRRVAKKGYIEYPNIFYEIINYQEVHLWLMNYRDNKIYFLDKSIFKSSYVHRSFRELFYANDKYMYQAFTRYKDFFFCGFEWENQIDYEIVDNYNALINEDDFIRIKTYFAECKSDHLGKKMEYIYKIHQYIKFHFKKMLSNKLRNYYIDSTAQLEKKNLIKIGKNAEIKDYVIIRTYSNLVKIGEYSQINPFTVIYGGGGVDIGNNVMIAPHCMIAGGNHNYKQTEKPMRFAGGFSKGSIVIEDNVWIGANCTITDGVHIGRDAVIGANSVLNKDVEPYSIVGGTPAKYLGNRLINGFNNTSESEKGNS